MLAVIAEVHRVTRPDATLLWNVERPQPLPLRELVRSFALEGWQQQHSPIASAAGYLLFAKQARFHWQPPAAFRRVRTRRAVSLSTGAVWWVRRPSCIPADGRRGAEGWGRLERLMLAASTRTACGTCGQPRPTDRDAAGRGAVRAACGHINPDGRCLIIDPYHQPGSRLARIAVRHGRSFLGIQSAAERREVDER